MKMKTLFLRIFPYLISLCAGAGIYLYSTTIKHDDDLVGLLSNISADFLSIPCIFICYEIVADICSRNVRQTVLEHTEFEVNDALIGILQNLRGLLRFKPKLTRDNLEAFLHRKKGYIREHLSLSPKLAEGFLKSQQALQCILYKQSTLEILPNERIKDIACISKELLKIARELENPRRAHGREGAAEAVERTLRAITGWLDFCEDDALINHHSFSLVE